MTVFPTLDMMNCPVLATFTPGELFCIHHFTPDEFLCIDHVTPYVCVALCPCVEMLTR